MEKRLILVGGAAGTGKTTTARLLAGRLRAGWLQVDSIWIALRAAAGPGTSAYALLDVPSRMARADESDDTVLAAHVAAAEAVCEVLPSVLTFELQTHDVLVADGAWLLPSSVRRLDLPDTEVSALYLQHADVDGLSATLARRLEGREPEERHLRMNRRIWQYGDWLAGEARDHGYPVMDPLPFAALEERVVAALTRQDPTLTWL